MFVCVSGDSNLCDEDVCDDDVCQVIQVNSADERQLGTHHRGGAERKGVITQVPSFSER